MFKNIKDDEIKDEYRLISRVRVCLKFFACVIDRYISERGNDLYKSIELIKDPIKFVHELIKLNMEMNDLVVYSLIP